MSEIKYAVCPDCRGNGTSSAYLGAFTSDDWHDTDEEWREDYVAGRFDRPCETCKGQRVVEACHCGEPLYYSDNPWSGRYALSACAEHLSEDDESALDSDQMSAMERAFGC